MGVGLRPGAKAPEAPPTPYRTRASPRLYTDLVGYPGIGESRREQLPPPPTATAPVVDSTSSRKRPDSSGTATGCHRATP